MKLSLQILGLCGLLFVQLVLADDDAECQFWNQLAYNLSHAAEQNGGTLRFACNSSCTDIRCSGHFQAKPMIPVDFDMDMCFGLRLNHCARNTSMDYYLDIPDKKINLTGSIYHNDSFDVPGPKLNGVQSTIVILVELVRVNATHILFGVNANVRVSIGRLPSFEDKKKVLPPMYIDVPPCTDKKPKAPFISPAMCKPLPVTATTPRVQTTPKGGSTPKPIVNSKTYNQSCELGVGNCEKNEMCKATTDENKLSRSGVCLCQPESKFDGKSGFCQPASQTTLQPTANPTQSPSVTIAQKGGDSGKKGGINMTAVIIGAVFGGLLLIVVVVSVIIFIGRRRRQADYRGRHQLLSDNDDDEDDTNVVI